MLDLTREVTHIVNLETGEPKSEHISRRFNSGSEVDVTVDRIETLAVASLGGLIHATE